MMTLISLKYNGKFSQDNKIHNKNENDIFEYVYYASCIFCIYMRKYIPHSYIYM